MSRIQTIPFYNPLDPTHPKSWPDYKLLMPLCAVGNIGQLACDLIISTLLSRQECRLVGRIYSPALMPVVGPNAFASHGPPTTSTEVYESKKHKLVIIQQRTSYFKELKLAYINELTQWIKEARFEQLIVLTSSFAQCNPDLSQLGDPSGSPIRSLTNKLFQQQSDTAKKWNKLGVKPLPDKSQLRVVKDGLTYLPGSGLTKPLIRACERAFIPAAFLIDFCSEGINLHDCYQVVDVLDRYLNLSNELAPAGALAAKSSDLKAALQDIERGLDNGSGTGGGDDADADGLARRPWVEPYSWTQAPC